MAIRCFVALDLCDIVIKAYPAANGKDVAIKYPKDREFRYILFITFKSLLFHFVSKAPG